MHLPCNRGGLRACVIVIGLLAGHATLGWIAFGTPFVLVGIALHLWAKGCLHQGREVTTAGPYRFVRHPFYLANAFLDLGIALMSGWWLLQLALPIWWLAVYIPVIRKEEAVMTGRFGSLYTLYRERVPPLIPYRRPLAKQPGGFSWRNPNLMRTEVPRTLRFLSYPLMFLIAYRVHSRGLDRLFPPTLFDLLAAAGCVSLYVAGKELRKHFKQHRPIVPSWILGGLPRFAILVGVIAVGWYVTSFEVEADWAIWPWGFTFLGLSAIARKTFSEQPAIAEALLAVGLAILFELHWLALLLLPLYVAIVLDMRLGEVLPTRGSLALPRSFRLASVDVYSFLFGVGVTLAMTKELWL